MCAQVVRLNVCAVWLFDGLYVPEAHLEIQCSTLHTVMVNAINVQEDRASYGVSLNVIVPRTPEMSKCW